MTVFLKWNTMPTTVEEALPGLKKFKTEIKIVMKVHILKKNSPLHGTNLPLE